MSETSKLSADSIENAVRQCYSTWGESYYDDYYGPSAAYPPVHLPLIAGIVDQASPKRLLDAGCGPASMLRHLVRPGREIYGFDLTPEMIIEAKRVMGALSVPQHRIWQGSIIAREAFDCPTERPETYDMVLGVGVLPHLQSGDEIQVIKNLHDCLKSGGMAVVEARNELFSLFTLNRYSKDFFSQRLLGTQHLLAQSGAEKAGLEEAIAQMEGMFRTDLPSIRRGKQGQPGYDEVVSRLHNPLVLGRQFADAGFSRIRTLFYHYHCLPPMLSDKVPQLFRKQSLAMEADPEDWRGYFMASAFVVVATRA